MSCMQDNAGSLYAQYPTPDNDQSLTNSSPSQQRTPGTLQSSQSNTIQLVDSFLSDITPHTPESILYSPALDVSLGDERTDLNLRKQREQPPAFRRSPRISSNQTPQTSEQQSDSTSLESQDSSNNRELINRDPAFEVLDESNDLLLLEQEKNTLNLRNLDSHRMDHSRSASLADTENRDINELRDLITTSNMILDSVHHSSVLYSKNHEVDNEMEDIEYAQTNGTFKQPHEVSRSELEREHENENEYSESVDFVIANEISDTLIRQSEHYNIMASKFSNLKFIKVEPESEEEIEQFTSPITPGVRRSTRKRTTTSYSYPRYSYSGSRRSKTRKRRRSSRKGTLSVTENEADVEVVNVDNEKKEETDEPVHNLPVQSDEGQEASENSRGIQGVGDGENIDENILDNDSQNNLYLKHDLRSRKIMLESPEVVDNGEEIEKEPTTSFSKKITRPKQPVKKTILKNTSKKSAKTIPKRRISCRLTSRKKNEDREWHPDEADNELGDDSETVMANSRDHSIPSKTRKTSTAPKKSKKVESIDVISKVSTKRRLSSKKAQKIFKPSKTTKEKKPMQGNRGRGKVRSGITPGSRLKNHDTTYKYSGGEETESEIEITKSISEVVDIVDDNSENQIVRELSDAEIEQNVAFVEESISTPTRPKRIRKSTNSSVINHTPKSSRSTRSRDVNKRDDKKVDDDVISNIREQSDKETADAMGVQIDITPSTQPKKTPRSTKGRGRGGKVKGRGARVGGNTSTEQPIVPIPDPHILEVSSGNQTILANALRVLTEKNFDLVDVVGTNLQNEPKRKRSESNATTNSEEDNNKEGEFEDKVPKRHRVEGNVSSGSGTTPPSQNMNISSQTSPNNSILSRLFGGWFNSGQSQQFNEEASG